MILGIFDLRNLFDVILFNLPALSEHSDEKLMAENTNQFILLSKSGEILQNDFNSIVNFFKNSTTNKLSAIGTKGNCGSNMCKTGNIKIWKTN